MKFPDFTGSDFIVGFRQLLRWCWSTRILGINGIPAKQTPNGSWLTLPIPQQTFTNTNTLPPLWPTLVISGTSEAPTYKVKFTTGYVNERIPGDAEALAVNEIKDLKWGGDAPEGKTAEDPREFTITIGQQASVIVYVDEDGSLGGSAAPSGYVAALTIETEDTASTHYLPPQGDESAGTPGVYHYKIAVLNAADADHPIPWIEPFLAGSHISHWRDLPRFKKQAGTYDIFKKYDGGQEKYKTKGLTEDLGDYGVKTIKITDTGDELKFATDGKNLNLQIFEGEVVDDGDGAYKIINFASDATSPGQVLYFRGGLFIGVTDPEDSPGDLTVSSVWNFIETA